MKRRVKKPVMEDVLITLCDICENEITGNVEHNKSWETNRDGKFVSGAGIDNLEFCPDCYATFRNKLRGIVKSMIDEVAK
jgi:hypothetical protein